MHKLISALILAIGITQPVLAEEKGNDTVERYGDWGKNCEQAPPDKDGKAGPEVCYIFQNVTNKDTGKVVMQVRVGKAPQNGKSVLIVTLPLGVLLPPGAVFVVEGHEKDPLKLPFLACAPEGCTTVGQVLEDKMLNVMKKGERAAIRVALINRQVLTLPVSLKGFTRAYIALGKS